MPGASAYYLGGAVVYTRQASVAWMSGAIETPHGMRGDRGGEFGDIVLERLAVAARILA